MGSFWPLFFRHFGANFRSSLGRTVLKMGGNWKDLGFLARKKKDVWEIWGGGGVGPKFGDKRANLGGFGVKKWSKWGRVNGWKWSEKWGGRGQKWGVKKGGNGGRQRKAMGVWMGADFWGEKGRFWGRRVGCYLSLCAVVINRAESRV